MQTCKGKTKKGVDCKSLTTNGDFCFDHKNQDTR
jgi:hypothetical protein